MSQHNTVCKMLFLKFLYTYTHYIQCRENDTQYRYTFKKEETLAATKVFQHKIEPTEVVTKLTATLQNLINS